MSARQGRPREGVDDLRRTQRVVAELWDRVPPPGVAYFPAAEDIPAFYCVGADYDTDGVVVAQSDGDIVALGVATQGALVRETVKVRTNGRINGAVSGRVANDPVYVGLDGSLVFAPPGGYSQVIAVCINATDIYVTVGVPVF